MPEQPWLICVDTGGTFTDCVSRDPGGGLHRAKVLSTSSLRGRVLRHVHAGVIDIAQQWGACDDLIVGAELLELTTGQPFGRVTAFDAARSRIELDHPGRQRAEPARSEPGTVIEVRSTEPAPVLVARLVTRTPPQTPWPPIHMRLATTRGTNALLERTGAAVALFITEGFGDLLVIGDQSRPDIFALDIIKPTPLHRHVVEVCERLNADGSVLRPLDERAVRMAASRLRDEQDVRAAAVALLHGHCNPAHEQRVAMILRECGFEQVSISSEIAPLMRILPRAQTAVVDAYLDPIIRDYLGRVRQSLARGGSESCRSRLHVMTSSGALNDADNFRACESLLSGPAGGVRGVITAARASGFSRVVGFDMGGTSTDVCRCDGELEYRFEHSVGETRLLAPALAIETVAAGGGSICDFVNGQLIVGPHSAGASPGPACYGLGGPLTLTDVNLLLGKLSAEQFEIPLSVPDADAALARLMTRIAAASAEPAAPPQPAELLSGLLEIANQRMATAIEQVSLRQGYDAREYALLAFGGAGGQHACAVADRLGMHTIVMPADASLLSAVGLMSASIERMVQKQVLQTLASCAPDLTQMIRTLAQQAITAVEAEGISREMIDIRRVIFDVRLAGQDATVQVEIGADDADDIAGILHARFKNRYAQIYGHEPPLDRKPVEVEALRVIASAKAVDRSIAAAQTNGPHTRGAPRSHHVCINGSWQGVPAFNRQELAPGATMDGPAIVLDRRSSSFIERGWRAGVDANGVIVARRVAPLARGAHAPQPEAVRLELFSHRFMSIATEMGHMLQRTALSTNVKERLDFSCTLLDSQGRLIANAPHLPVHLGAMGMCVRAVRDVMAMQPGDVVITNHPAFGGSHLPDITLIAPVFSDNSLIGYVANRAHHAEVGGTRPGSMPPNAKSLQEEGVVIAPTHLVRQGKPQWERIERMLQQAAHPSRAIADNLADLQAQLAANQHGIAAMQTLARLHGRNDVARQMQALTDRAARLAREAIDRLPRDRLHAVERLDDGSRLSVSIDLTLRPVVIDFTDTAPQHAGNLNATPAIVSSAVIYVLRLLVGEPLPLNEGLLRNVEIRLRRGSLLDPIFDLRDAMNSPAVVGGNTEVSQRLVDVLLKALGLMACSQGTMNNTLFGGEHFGYYETVCGGAGATPRHSGASAVHTHMTNTRITDPEVIEHRYPVRLERFAIRTGSGGAGMHRGGDGAVREITFLESMALSVLSQHRVEAPFGMNGGAAGERGRQRVIRANGSVLELGPVDACDVCAGDRMVLETPGGGGWGTAADGA